jgi:hypothetical protein
MRLPLVLNRRFVWHAPSRSGWVPNVVRPAGASARLLIGSGSCACEAACRRNHASDIMARTKCLRDECWLR